MNKNNDSSAEVEQLLYELAAQECRMDDAMTVRCLAAIEDEVRRSTRRRAYKRMAQGAAAALVLGAGIGVCYVEGPTQQPAGSSVPVTAAPEATEALVNTAPKAEPPDAPPAKPAHGEIAVSGHFEYQICTDTL